jgi:hypothetical protein
VTLALARNEWTASLRASLSRERPRGAYLNRKIGAHLVGLESFGGGGGEISLLPLSTIKPRFLGCQARSLVTVPTTSFRQLYRMYTTWYCLCIIPFLSNWLRYEHGRYPARTPLCGQNRFTQSVLEEITFCSADAWLFC